MIKGIGTIYFKSLSESGLCPERKHENDAGYDLFVSREVTIPSESWQDVHTDIAIALPDGIWGEIAGRSSTFRVRGLQVQHGVIDPGYRGELFIAVYNFQKTAVKVCRGDRLAQLIPHMVYDIVWREVGNLPDSDRGDAGFGSTGK